MKKIVIRIACSDCRMHGGGEDGPAVSLPGEYLIATPGAHVGVKESVELLVGALGGVDRFIVTPHTDCAYEGVVLEQDLRGKAHLQKTEIIPFLKNSYPDAEVILEMASHEPSKPEGRVREFSGVNASGERAKWSVFRL